MTRAFTWHHNVDLVTVTVLFNTLLKNVNFRHYLHEQRRRVMVFIFQININCGKTFHPVFCFSSWLLTCYWWLPFIYGCHISNNSYSNCFTWFHWMLAYISRFHVNCIGYATSACSVLPNSWNLQEAFLKWIEMCWICSTREMYRWNEYWMSCPLVLYRMPARSHKSSSTVAMAYVSIMLYVSVIVFVFLVSSLSVLAMLKVLKN